MWALFFSLFQADFSSLKIHRIFDGFSGKCGRLFSWTFLKNFVNFLEIFFFGLKLKISYRVSPKFLGGKMLFCQGNFANIIEIKRKNDGIYRTPRRNSVKKDPEIY